MDVNIALDTNAYSDLTRGDMKWVDVVQSAQRVYLPLFVLGELYAGFKAGSRGAANAARLRNFLNLPGVSSLMPDEETAVTYAGLSILLKQNGTPIPTNDVWIASLVIQHGLILCSSDAHFDHLPQLARR